MSPALAIPEPGTLTPAEFRTRVELVAADAETVEEADALRRAVDAWEKWANPRDLAERLDVRRAQRIAELRVGELLPSEQGARTDLEPRSQGYEVPKPVDAECRLMASFGDRVREELGRRTDPEDVTRRALVSLCRRWKVEHTPAAAELGNVAADYEVGKARLLHGDFREVLNELPDGSVDLIVTDPPYPAEELPLWSDLSKHAARLLSPRGILFGWSGQIYLPLVMARLSEHLTYGWTFSLGLPGSGSRIMGRHIIQAWKPVLAYTVKTWPSGEWGDDVLISPTREKGTYEWQQNAAPAVRLIERYCAPDGLVLDPFLGAGSFGAAAVQLGRRFIGVEQSRKRFDQACQLLQEATA